MEQDIKKWISVNKIKRQFKESIANPSYKLCQRRLIREFNECIDYTSKSNIVMSINHNTLLKRKFDNIILK